MPKRDELKRLDHLHRIGRKGALTTAMRARKRRGLPPTATAVAVKRAGDRDWYAKNGSAYRQANAKKIRAKQARYAKANAEKLREKARRYYAWLKVHGYRRGKTIKETST